MAKKSKAKRRSVRIGGAPQVELFEAPASELASGLEPHGIQITDLKGMTYAAIERDWRLSRDLDVNYLAFGVKR